MKRLHRAVILAELVEQMRAYGSWCGETHIQKAVYFLQELLQVPMAYNYILYKHGPFSFDLRDEITDFRAYELFRLEPRPVPYGSSLSPTANAKELKGRFPTTLNNYNKCTEFVAKVLDGKGVAELERVATAMYVTRKYGRMAPADRAKCLHELKPHVSYDDALAAVNEFDKIEEVAGGFVIKNDE